ncbi:MAG: type II toxin-antitoxin system RelE/ParE family toxin [bacterium]|nr:type II toxin-antitoxin system RelE/ParE family toxin [bacterium]
MASYRLLIKPFAAKEIESAPKKDRLRIIKRIQDLSSDPRPHGCEKLSGHDDKYRIRQGTYRIVYTISDAGLIICIVKVGHRKEVYR